MNEQTMDAFGEEAVALSKTGRSSVDKNGDEVFSISELCREFGVTARTLRFYEDKGLLSPARAKAVRVYNRKDRARLKLILRSKSIGASLSEIRQFLDLYDQGDGQKSQLEFVIERTAGLLIDLEKKRQAIDKTLEEVREINRVACRELADRRGD